MNIAVVFKTMEAVSPIVEEPRWATWELNSDPIADGIRYRLVREYDVARLDRMVLGEAPETTTTRLCIGNMVVNGRYIAKTKELVFAQCYFEIPIVALFYEPLYIDILPNSETPCTAKPIVKGYYCNSRAERIATYKDEGIRRFVGIDGKERIFYLVGGKIVIRT